MSSQSKILCLTGALLLLASLFVPLWRIELDAPQYPEGLALQIYPHKLGGDVEIINGLNHYIGMQTLHADNFIEFTLLPYIISVFVILFLLTALFNRKRILFYVFGLFVLFGVVAMIDFWRWEYNYGHNLDPNAAIIVPGMAYQPPLIGFKQLLNFGAYSIPDTGGWLFIGAGLVLLAAVLKENGFLNRLDKKGRNLTAFLAGFLFFIGCGIPEPEAIRLHQDKCEYCKMNIADGRFAAEMITQKGRIYKYDDISCMVNYINQNPEPQFHSLWVCQYDKPGELIDAQTARYVQSEALRSPMAGNTAAFLSAETAAAIATKFQGSIVDWKTVFMQF